ncbi:MAG: TIM barrel protein [Candidatus Bathyarchaeia archaeon]
MVKLSVCVEMIFTELPFLDRIGAVAEAEFEALEFWGWRNKDIDAILKRKEEHGLEVSSFGVDPGGNIVDYNTRDVFIKGLRDSIEVAHKLGCARLIVTTGNEMTGVPRVVQHQNVVKILKDAAKLAENANITLVLEPLNVLVDHKGYYLYSSSEGFEILREVGSPNVKLLYDIYHQQITEGNLIETISNNIKLIGHFHAADVPGRHEFGTGEINYSNVLKRIDELGYDGFVGLEFMPLEDSKEALKAVRRVLESIN